jgi:hypothetical protein
MREIFEKLSRACERRSVFAPVAALIAFLGILLRVAWVAKDGRIVPVDSEMLWVARSFATTGQLADAYGPGTGRTAHVAPVMPVFAGTIYRLFGITSLLSEIILITAGLLVVAFSVWTVDRAVSRLGAPAVVRLAGLAIFVLAPLNLSLEMLNFRVWEGAVAAAGVGGALAFVLWRETQPGLVGWREAVLLSLLGGVMTMISPPAALAIYGLLGLLFWRTRGFLAAIPAAALSLVLMIVISLPWAIRNEAIFGEKVWSRTNFGFNFALGFHDAAVAPTDPRGVFVNRLAEIDPYTSKHALATLKAVGGEQAYSKLWSDRTKAWISNHPLGAAEIAGRHAFEFYFPPRWFWSVYSDNATALAPRQALIWIISIGAWLAVASRLLAKDWRYLYVLAVLTLPAAPYIMAQPILRYRYPIVALMTYLAIDLAWRIAARALGPNVTSSVDLASSVDAPHSPPSGSST